MIVVVVVVVVVVAAVAVTVAVAVAVTVTAANQLQKRNGDHIVSGSALLDVRHGYDVRSKVDTRKEQRVLQGLRRREGSTC